MFGATVPALLMRQMMPTPNLKVINLYDFDGVLASPFEEALFSMPATAYDADFVRKVSRRHRMDLSQESQSSQRYICIQATLYDCNLPIEPGVVTPDYENPYYILTARSDCFAVRRMHDYVEYCLPIKPIKTQHLDHLPKGQAIEVLLERHPDTHFNFYDDNLRHVTSARLLRSDRLEVFHVDNDMKQFYVEAESFYKEKILELAL